MLLEPMDKPEQKKLLVSLKIIIPLWVTFILIVFSIFFIFVPLLEKNILNQKREMIRNLIDTNWSLISEYDQMVKNGELELGVAQSEVLQRIRNLRYGRDGKDYFWINDMQPRMIMHPYSTHLENKDMSNLMDSNGKRLVMEFVKVVKQKGAGYVDYMWQWKDDPEKIVPKISYIRGFKPWGWMIGTGIYIEDVRNEIALIVKGLIKVFSGLLVLIIGLSSYITWQAIKSEEKHTKAEEALNKSKEGYKTIFENTGTATVIVEKNKIISMANDKFCDLSGYSREEIEGKKTWLEFVAPKDLKKMKAEHKLRILAGKPTLKTYEFRFIDKYNSIKHILLEVDLVPGTEKSVSSLLDITKRKVAEHALESSHERFLTILNSIDATIYVADMKTHEIIFV
ncbi:MAG: PAS domain S-box protein, partial [Desulfobacteraceae bacterium]|nr:PAS domain S-box protein [Desulfobacteraceae bacterium]